MNDETVSIYYDPEVDIPGSIGELKLWYEYQNLPPQSVTRFFIGENYTQPKAFGIYQEGENFIVYKNKADGSRAIRYNGKNESYAVNELFERLVQEIDNQGYHIKTDVRKYYNRSRSIMEPGEYTKRPPVRKQNKSTTDIVTTILVILFYIFLFVVAASNATGHGSSSGSRNSYHNSYHNYDYGNSWSSGSDWGSSWDSGSDWGSSWDSGSTDWGSDW